MKLCAYVELSAFGFTFVLAEGQDYQEAARFLVRSLDPHYEWDVWLEREDGTEEPIDWSLDK